MVAGLLNRVKGSFPVVLTEGRGESTAIKQRFKILGEDRAFAAFRDISSLARLGCKGRKPSTKAASGGKVSGAGADSN